MSDVPITRQRAKDKKQDKVEEKALAQAAFDQLNKSPPQRQQKQKRPAITQGRLQDLQLDERYQGVRMHAA